MESKSAGGSRQAGEQSEDQQEARAAATRLRTAWTDRRRDPSALQRVEVLHASVPDHR